MVPPTKPPIAAPPRALPPPTLLPITAPARAPIPAPTAAVFSVWPVVVQPVAITPTPARASNVLRMSALHVELSPSTAKNAGPLGVVPSGAVAVEPHRGAIVLSGEHGDTP